LSHDAKVVAIDLAGNDDALAHIFAVKKMDATRFIATCSETGLRAQASACMDAMPEMTTDQGKPASAATRSLFHLDRICEGHEHVVRP
jgi:hypothetical protein